jgi:hypothetical protein
MNIIVPSRNFVSTPPMIAVTSPRGDDGAKRVRAAANIFLSCLDEITAEERRLDAGSADCEKTARKQFSARRSNDFASLRITPHFPREKESGKG